MNDSFIKTRTCCHLLAILLSYLFIHDKPTRCQHKNTFSKMLFNYHTHKHTHTTRPPTTPSSLIKLNCDWRKIRSSYCYKNLKTTGFKSSKCSDPYVFLSSLTITEEVVWEQHIFMFFMSFLRSSSYFFSLHGSVSLNFCSLSLLSFSCCWHSSFIFIFI